MHRSTQVEFISLLIVSIRNDLAKCVMIWFMFDDIEIAKVTRSDNWAVQHEHLIGGGERWGFQCFITSFDEHMLHFSPLLHICSI
jgi:hypothetical protein